MIATKERVDMRPAAQLAAWRRLWALLLAPREEEAAVDQTAASGTEASRGGDDLRQ